MEWVETTARTLDEAKDRALDQLGVDEDDAEFEIIEEPRPGLFGRVRGEARVRARVRPTQPRPKVDRRDRRRRRDEDNERSTATASGTADDRSGSDGSGRTRAGRGGKKSGDAAAVAAVATAAVEGAAASSGSGTRGGANAATVDGTAARRTARSSATEDPSPAASRRPAHEESSMTDGEQATHDRAEVEAGAVAFLEGLLDAFGLEGRVSVREPADGELEAVIDGDDLGLLVGPKGQTLLAIQDLTRLIAQRHLGPGSPRLGVDVAGYRQRRVEALRRFSHQLAAQVRETGTPKALEPMNAADRKVVHDALTDADGVSTMSEGEEPYRRVVIVPASAG
jgi:spoIIIJ-associated protein